MKTIFELKQVTLAVQGDDAQFPVNRVYCVGRNYAEHAKEMGADPSREAPFLSLIHISEPTRQAEISYAVFCLKTPFMHHVKPISWAVCNVQSIMLCCIACWLFCSRSALIIR